MRNVVSEFNNCFGCGVCAAACPKNIIKIKLNSSGFYKPTISEEEKCVSCGLCLDVCAFNHDDLALKGGNIHSWAAWSNDDEIRRKCSSGGIGFEIGKQLIEKGYHAVGCRYNITKQRAEHFIATTENEFIQSIGSKYIQSFTEEAFKQIDRKHYKYLVIGTPCQIDSFRRMVQKFNCEDNFVLMDFFCHCVPSMWAWRAYVNMLEPHIGEITYASWRNKFQYGWHDSWCMGIDGKNTSEPVDWHDSYNILIKEKKSYVQSRMSQGDLFYKLFLGDICLGPQCQKQCKYKYDQSSADIRIGDLWGEKYKDDQKGVSALVCFTSKGYETIESLKNVTLIEHPFEVVAEGQMKENAKQREFSPLFMYMLKNEWKINGPFFQGLYQIQRIVGKILKLI